MKRFIGSLLFAAVAVFASTATSHAYTCSVIGESGGNPGGVDVYGCTGLVEGDVINFTDTETFDLPGGGQDIVSFTGSVTVTDISAGEVTLSISLTNNSNGDIRLTSFGLGIDPDAKTGTVTGAEELTTFSQSNFAGFQLVEFCAAAGNNCAGGGNGGIAAGATDTFDFNLTNGFVEGGTIDLSQFAAKFQSGANDTSYQKPGCIGECVPEIPETPEIPEIPETPETPVSNPATMALLGGSLLGLAALNGVRNAVRRFRK